MGQVRFGTNEDITCIVDVSLKGGDEQDLCLAYKTSTLFVFAGVYLEDDGYVLKAIKDDFYYPLPPAAELSQLQAEGLLPAPLPKYEIPAAQYFMGYSLWIVIAAVATFHGLRALVRRLFASKQAPAAPSPILPE
jgi:hypothetical protein